MFGYTIIAKHDLERLRNDVGRYSDMASRLQSENFQLNKQLRAKEHENEYSVDTVCSNCRERSLRWIAKGKTIEAAGLVCGWCGCHTLKARDGQKPDYGYPAPGLANIIRGIR
jgi:hypothetical protein